MKRRADWLAWMLQFIVGLPVGAVVGGGIVFGVLRLLLLRSDRREMELLATGTGLIFLAGSALIGAALASYFGDRLWLGPSVFSDEYAQSRPSRVGSWIAGQFGTVLILAALVRWLL